MSRISDAKSGDASATLVLRGPLLLWKLFGVAAPFPDDELSGANRGAVLPHAGLRTSDAASLPNFINPTTPKWA
jgi:hypothetical protein